MTVDRIPAPDPDRLPAHIKEMRECSKYHRGSGRTSITDRQVEIMTATLCEAVVNIREHAGDDAPAAMGALIAAMVKQVGRLNEAIATAVAEPEVRVTINSIGRPAD